jgi:peroxiredoxin
MLFFPSVHSRFSALFVRVARKICMLSVGENAPPFQAKDQHGKTVKLSDFAGKTVVLWFYPKADTPG